MNTFERVCFLVKMQRNFVNVSVPLINNSKVKKNLKNPVLCTLNILKSNKKKFNKVKYEYIWNLKFLTDLKKIYCQKAISVWA